MNNMNIQQQRISNLCIFYPNKRWDWDLSINRYKEMVYEEVEYDAPKLILQRIDLLDLERKSLLDNFKNAIL